MVKEGLKIIGGVIVGFGILFSFAWFVNYVHVSVDSSSSQAQVIGAHNGSIYASSKDIYIVSRVVDGDTIVISKDGKNETVRLIGVNTPETVDPRKPVQCFGKEASDFLKKILAGKTVRLESDPSQENRDKYNRLLRYVYVDDILVNEEIISSGYGFEYTYDVPYEFQKEFISSEAYARAGKLGLWSPDTCNGELK